jgi:hypothetical protein
VIRDEACFEASHGAAFAWDRTHKPKNYKLFSLS